MVQRVSALFFFASGWLLAIAAFLKERISEFPNSNVNLEISYHVPVQVFESLIGSQVIIIFERVNQIAPLLFIQT
jgi:hypothetical protein